MARRTAAWKVGILIAWSLLPLLLFTALPLVSVTGQARASERMPAIVSVKAQQTPIVTDPTVTALEKEKLTQEVDQLKNANFWSWTSASTFFSTMALILAGILGCFCSYQWGSCALCVMSESSSGEDAQAQQRKG